MHRFYAIHYIKEYGIGSPSGDYESGIGEVIMIRLIRKLVGCSIGLLGILLAWSDGGWFPWVNYVGLGIFGIMIYVANRSEDRCNRLQ